MTEIWKAIPGYEGKYEVSDMGRVRSLDRRAADGRRVKGQLMKQFEVANGKGYLFIGLKDPKKQFYVHRLVGFAFVPGYFEGAQINHIDENTQNNCATNLEWVTNKQNNNHGNHCLKVGRSKAKRIAQYTTDGEFVAYHESLPAAAKKMGCCVSAIFNVLDKEGRTSAGYVWKRAWV